MNTMKLQQELAKNSELDVTALCGLLGTISEQLAQIQQTQQALSERLDAFGQIMLPSGDVAPVPSKYVSMFWGQLHDKFVWDLLPLPFLYELFDAWVRKNNLQEGELTKTKFTQDLRRAISKDPAWLFDNPKQMRQAANHFDSPEPLLDDYGVAWRHDAQQKRYKGPIRIVSSRGENRG